MLIVLERQAGFSKYINEIRLGDFYRISIIRGVYRWRITERKKGIVSEKTGADI